MIGLELPLKVVQARLGHASIQMTADTYGHLFPRSDDGAELAAAERAGGGAVHSIRSSRFETERHEIAHLVTAVTAGDCELVHKTPT